MSDPDRPVDDVDADDVPEHGGPGRVHDVGGRSPGRGRRLIVPIVVLVLAVIGLALIWSGTRGGDDAPEGAEILDLGPPIGLGSFADVADLRGSLRDGLVPADDDTDEPDPTDDTTTTVVGEVDVTSPATLSRCAVQTYELFVGEDPDPVPTAAGIADLADEQVFVYEFRTPAADHPYLLGIVNPTDCDLLAIFVRD